MKVLTKSHFRGSWWCPSSHIFQLPSKRPGGKTGGFTQTLISRNANLLQFPAATRPSCPHQREKTLFLELQSQQEELLAEMKITQGGESFGSLKVGESTQLQPHCAMLLPGA